MFYCEGCNEHNTTTTVVMTDKVKRWKRLKRMKKRKLQSKRELALELATYLGVHVDRIQPTREHRTATAGSGDPFLEQHIEPSRIRTQ